MKLGEFMIRAVWVQYTRWCFFLSQTPCLSQTKRETQRASEDCARMVGADKRCMCVVSCRSVIELLARTATLFGQRALTLTHALTYTHVGAQCIQFKIFVDSARRHIRVIEEHSLCLLQKSNINDNHRNKTKQHQQMHQKDESYSPQSLLPPP